MTQKRSPDNYHPFVVGGDGEIFVHGSGPGEADEAVDRANRSLNPDERPKVSRVEFGEHHAGYEIRSGTGGRTHPDSCPHCHMVHPDDPESDVDCRELIAVAQELLPSHDPDGDYCEVVVRLNCAASVEEVRSSVDAIMTVVPGALNAMIAVSEETFLSTVASISRTQAQSELVGVLGEVADLVDEQEEVKRNARNN